MMFSGRTKPAGAARLGSKRRRRPSAGVPAAFVGVLQSGHFQLRALPLQRLHDLGEPVDGEIEV
ncbi:MAG: hypothetical protein J2P53_06220, partial [Bradyrhizobiaceae bacterium]|nr:hypothetical protein [Bradyrhizobiaceae bacterium]